MLQQSDLIFDFASDHVNMSQVSKGQAVMLFLSSLNLPSYNLIFWGGLQLGSYSDYPPVIVEQVPHSHLLSYGGLTYEQTDHQPLLKGQCAQRVQLTLIKVA